MAPKITVEQGVTWFKFSSKVFQTQRDREADDLRCQTPEGMWPEAAAEMRRATTVAGVSIPARPMLSIPTMDEPIQLVLNGQRKAHLAITVHSLSEDATDDTAEAFMGLFRAYEREGRAHLARAWAFDRKVRCGTGWYRMITVYDPDGGHPLDQKLLPKRILYQNAVIPDPFAEEMDWSDGKRLMYVADVPLDTYKSRYSDSKVNAEDYDAKELESAGNEAPGWIGGDGEESRTIRVAEEYYVEVTTTRRHLLDDNSMSEGETIPAGRTKKTGDDARSGDFETRTVWRRVISCFEEVEPWAEQDGQYIPFIFDPGRELQPVDGKRIWYGMYATAKQPAQLVNYAASGAVEMASLEPKAPWMMAAGVDADFTEEYKQSAVRNIPVLHYNQRDLNDQPAPPPSRVQVDVSRLGPSMQLLAMGREFVQAATSTFDPALGKQPTAHRSGRALIALQDQTVEGTSHYLENHKDIAMTHEARVFLDRAPFVYDRPGRIARVLDEQGDSSMIMVKKHFVVNPKTKRPQPVQVVGDAQAAAENPESPVKYIDLSKGRYGVTFTIGKSRGDRLQQGSEEMGDILSADPALMPIIGPEYFRFRDFPGAKKIADLLKKMRDHQFPWLSDTPQAMDPQRVLAENQALKQQLGEAVKAIETKQIEQAGKYKIAEMQENADTSRAKADRELKLAVAEIAALTKSLQDSLKVFAEERARLGLQGHEIAQDAAQHDHEVQMADMAHQQEMVQNEQAQAHNVETIAATPPPTTGTEGNGA